MARTAEEQKRFSVPVGPEPRTLTMDDWDWYRPAVGLGIFSPAKFESFLLAAGYRHGREGIAPTLPDWAVEETEEQHRKWRRRSVACWLTYFARGRYSGRIKIGKTQQRPEVRISQLAFEQPYGEESVLLCTRRGEHFEGLYHKVFDTWRVGGEWFAPHPDILAEIDRLSAHPTPGLPMRARAR